MREIKFRCWDKANKQMITGKNIDVLLKNINNNKSHIYQQYTGLKDKNGVEIYEGDILKIEVQDCCYALYEVSWNNNKASFSLTEVGSEYEESFNDWLSTETFTVIGNIYENSNLLGDNIEQN